MKELSERLHESCSAAILQGTEIVYVARVPTRRIMSVAVSVGTRLAGVPHVDGPRAARLSRPMTKSGGGCDRCASSPRRRAPSPTCRRCSIASATTTSRASRSSTRSSSAACARSPCRSSTGRARPSPPSTSAPTPPARPATRCATDSCRSCARWRRKSRRSWRSVALPALDQVVAESATFFNNQVRNVCMAGVCRLDFSDVSQ